MKDLDDKPCNGCTVCCEVYEIAELGKSPKATCKHRTRSGCDIYADRPFTCQQYTCAWKANKDWPDFMWPKKSGIVLQLGVIEGHAEVEAHLTHRGLQKWTLPKYRAYIIEAYRQVRAGFQFVTMRVHKTSGAGLLLYDEVPDKFVPIGKPGSDRENFLLGYPIGAPALFGTNARMTELQEKMNADFKKLRQLPQKRQQQATAEFLSQWQKIFADSMS